MQPIVLRAQNGDLVVTHDEHGVADWIQVTLKSHGAERVLGAERVRYIADQLVAFLTDSRPTERCVLSLAEVHVVFYGQHLADDQVRLRLQDAHAQFFAALELTAADKRQWLDQLREHIKQLPR